MKQHIKKWIVRYFPAHPICQAKNNTVKDFESSYFDDIDDALIVGLEQNQDFFSLLLSNDEIKRQVFGIYTEEKYRNLRNT